MASTPAEKLSQRAKLNKDLHPSRPKIQNLFSPYPSAFISESNALDLDILAEDPSYLLNTLYYTDAISEEEPTSYYDAYDAMKRKKWLHDAYHEHLTSNLQSSN